MLFNSFRVFPALLQTFSLNYFLVSVSIVSIPVIVVEIAILMSNADFLRSIHPLINTNQGSGIDKYDFIVVGGGSAGSVIAGRLCKNFRVLLLEAGGDPHPLTYIPAAASALLNQPIIDWQYKTEPLVTSGFGLPNQGGLAWPRGKSLGGSSNSNFMIYMRGNPQDFDSWANITEDPRWSYANVEKYFNRFEDYHGHWAESRTHGVGGPMHIEKAGYSPSVEYWLNAGRELGLQTTFDPNYYQMEGFHRLDLTTKRGVRFSTYRGYILPNLGNPNLTIHRYSIATKIHFDDKLQAVGVSYLRHSIPHYAEAKKEIILSAGAINSPQLLMLSGIGPKKHLQEIGIEPLVDSPVGENLQDHVTAFVPVLLDKAKSSVVVTRDVGPLTASQYLISGRGFLSSPDGIQATGLISSSHAALNHPDILFVNLGLGIHEHFARDLSSYLGWDFHTFNNYLNLESASDANVIIVTVAKPKSRGTVRLRDKNPLSHPKIDPNYFSDRNGEDINVMVQGLEFIAKLYENTTTYQNLGARMIRTRIPACDNSVIESQSYWKCYARTFTSTIFHPCGTCAMGKPGHSATVVDSQLRVVGTKGLRVVDASVMTTITNANLNAPTIMIGEVGAELIQNTWS